MSNEPLQVTNKTVEITQETVQPNVSCPSPVVEPDVSVNVTDEYRHIQNPDMDSDTRLVGDSFRVENIDNYGIVYGSSMAPSLMNGDVIMTERFEETMDLQEGMIIRFNTDYGAGKSVHRVVGDYQRDGFVMTRGDSNEESERVEVSNVTHVVKGVVFN